MRIPNSLIAALLLPGSLFGAEVLFNNFLREVVPLATSDGTGLTQAEANVFVGTFVGAGDAVLGNAAVDDLVAAGSLGDLNAAFRTLVNIPSPSVSQPGLLQFSDGADVDAGSLFDGAPIYIWITTGASLADAAAEMFLVRPALQVDTTISENPTFPNDVPVVGTVNVLLDAANTAYLIGTSPAESGVQVSLVGGGGAADFSAAVFGTLSAGSDPAAELTGGTPIGDDFYVIPGFGVFYGGQVQSGDTEAWIYHTEHGWLFWDPSSDDLYFFHEDANSWAYTTLSLYPYIFLYDGSFNTWAFYVFNAAGETDAGRWFYLFDESTWVTLGLPTQ